ncbi:unnamed protein product [marine sediment metagenome]|uniref:Uncharacterized protein n=1 Tax=marine sediment metagenome TaxID=412755 RepID=X0W864_9ZZZZ
MAKKLQNKAKAKAWEKFSRFIRVRDCLAATGLPFVGVCITCGRRFHIRYLQAGHCLPGRSNAKLFDEKLVFAQCKYCNEVKHGEKKKYEAKMITKYGKAKFEQMKIDAKKIIKYVDYEQLAKTYNDKYIALMKSCGFKTWLELLKQERN